MRLLGIDWGKKRIGLALSDEQGKIAFPYTTIFVVSLEQTIKKIKEIIKKETIDQIVLGMPLKTKSADEVHYFMAALEGEIETPVALYDERLSTQATQRLFKEKISRRQRSKARKELSKSHDAVSAMLILQSYIEGGIME